MFLAFQLLSAGQRADQEDADNVAGYVIQFTL